MTNKAFSIFCLLRTNKSSKNKNFEMHMVYYGVKT
jgi:hypothetical protein